MTHPDLSYIYHVPTCWSNPTSVILHMPAIPHAFPASGGIFGAADLMLPNGGNVPSWWRSILFKDI